MEVGYESLCSFSARFQSLTTLSPTTFRREARKIYGGFGKWPLYYVPSCYQYVFLQPGSIPNETQESRSVPARLLSI